MSTQLDLLSYRAPAPRSPLDGVLNPDGTVRDPSLLATLPLVDGDGATWWYGAIFDARGKNIVRVAQFAPATWNGATGECWHIATYGLADGDDCHASIKPMTRVGALLFLLCSEFDVRRARWVADAERRGPVPYVRIYTPGARPDMYWGNPWGADPREVTA